MEGKVDWFAHNLSAEGDDPEPPTAGRLSRDDAVRCRLDDRVGDVRRLIGDSPYPFALVTTPDGVLLGRLPRSALDCDPDLRTEEVMDPGPSTVRPHTSAAGLAKRLAERNLRYGIVTTPEGRLLGVTRREDAERAQ